jgi:polyisoprenoid-binding protein YceI
MKTAILAIVFGTLAGPAGNRGPDALASPRDPMKPDIRVWLTGSSNLRGFTCRATDVSGTIDLQAHATRRSILSGENTSNAPSLRIPVALLDCGVTTMNRHLREALRADVYETIEFHLDSYDVRSGARPTARIAGRLRIAGAERAIVAAASIEADTLGDLHVRGTHGLRMSEFGVQPPRRFGGLLRVRDDIVVHFDIVPAPGGGDVVTVTSHDIAGGSNGPSF